MASNRVIGQNNRLPWRLPADLQHFKQLTMGKPILMGRKTYESIGRPLPGRRNIILSRDPKLAFDGCDTVNRLEQALELAQSDQAPQLMVIGGAQIYAQTLPLASKLYLTEVKANPDGDALFPEFDRSQWQIRRQTQHAADEQNDHDYRFLELERA